MTAPRSTVLVGGGPAGTALLIAASKNGRLAGLAGDGLAVVERSPTIGSGRIETYAITSDSTAATFLTAVKDNPHNEMAALIDHPGALRIAEYLEALGVPLHETGPYLRAIGGALDGIVRANGGEVLTGHEALWAQRTNASGWRTRVRRLDTGEERDLLSRNLVLATGGHQPTARLADERVAGEALVGIAGDRLLQSDEMLALGGIDRALARLAGIEHPRIVVIGGSTSALTTANLLLKTGIGFGPEGLTLLHRRPLRPFYPSADAARQEGFMEFGAEDICPISGFVYRLAGFRLEARELLLRMLGIGGRTPDPRFRLQRITGDGDREALDTIERAHLVIAALGYRPHALPLRDISGAPIALGAQGRGRPPLVDRHCRVVDAAGRPLPNAYGIGLAAGFVPWGKLGGEASFTGQANGLWLWQNDVGMMIVNQLLADDQRQVA